MESKDKQNKGNNSVASPFGLRSSLRQSGGRFAAGLDAGLKPSSNPKGKGEGKRQRQNATTKSNDKSKMGVFFAALRMTSKERQTTTAATVGWETGLHTAHRKVRDGWGTRLVVAAETRERHRSRSLSGMTTKNSKGKDKSRDEQKQKQILRLRRRMTTKKRSEMRILRSVAKCGGS